MGEWISVKDKNPPYKNPFLAMILCGFYYKGIDDDRIKDIACCIWNGEKFEEYCHCTVYEHDREYIEVTHWMPIPEPPKE